MFSSPPIWKQAPFVRLIAPLVTGILLQSYCELRESVGIYICCLSCGLLATLPVYGTKQQFKLHWLTGVFVNSLFLSVGAILFTVKQSRNELSIQSDSRGIIVKLEESLVEKPKSFKAIASIQVVLDDNMLVYPKTNLILYLQKNSATRSLVYGTRIVFQKKLQPVSNSGNPGAFDYRRYCAFQNIHHQIYLKSGEFSVLPGLQKSFAKSFLLDTRTWILNIIRRYIPGEKRAGLAEALLIGYKNDLDKELTQSYVNTGVAHIIAISGLHVGVIYVVLTSILNFFIRSGTIRWLRIILTIAGLWIFTLLAGGSPSVLRSAVMFTFIICGQSVSKNISIYNSLAASAFVMLCYNPYWFWDVGFQLSYAAVLSIVIFMKPIYNLMFIQNKLLDLIWKMNAVTLSAQILTTPLCLYYFNQFPTFFILTNLIAVPLSSLILFGELMLCLTSSIPFVAVKLGWLLSLMISLMNSVINRVEQLPFSLVRDIHFTTGQAILSYIIIAGSTIWMMRLKKVGLFASLLSILALGALRLKHSWQDQDQLKIIVYNVPTKQAIDIIEGNRHFFIGDSTLLKDRFQTDFYLRPSRILHRATHPASGFHNLKAGILKVGNHRLAIVGQEFRKPFTGSRQRVTAVIISGNAPVSISSIREYFNCTQIIFDASNSSRQITKWKNECARLKLEPHTVAERGAFVMILN